MMNRVILKKNLRDVGLSIGAGLRAADYTFTGNAIIDDGALFPPGGSGELWIDWVGASSSYYNHAELTVDKFASNSNLFNQLNQLN